MKRLFALLLAIVFVLSTVAAVENSTTQNQSTDNATDNVVDSDSNVTAGDDVSEADKDSDIETDDEVDVTDDETMDDVDDNVEADDSELEEDDNGEQEDEVDVSDDEAMDDVDDSEELNETEDSAKEDVDDEDEKEVKIMLESNNGAKLRILQIQKATTKAYIIASTVIDYLDDKGENVSELELLLNEIDVLKEEAFALDPDDENSVDEFVRIKKDLKDVAAEFRKIAAQMVTLADRRELDTLVRDALNDSEDLADLQDEIIKARNAVNAQRVRNMLQRMGFDNDELITKIRQGKISEKEIAKALRERYKKLPPKKKEIARKKLAEQIKEREMLRKKAVQKIKQKELERIKDKTRDELRQRALKRLEERVEKKVRDKLVQRMKDREKIVQRNRMMVDGGQDDEMMNDDSVNGTDEDN